MSGAWEKPEKMLGTNGADRISDIEHVAIGIRAGRLQRSQVAGASTGSASDQGKVARVARRKLGNQRVSNPNQVDMIFS